MGDQAEQHQKWWQQIKTHPVRTVLIALLVVAIVLIMLSTLGYIFNWGWTGLGPYISPPHPKDSDFQRGKTLWDWMQLLIIPAVLAVAGYVINLTISRGEQAATEQRAQSEREATEKRAETERKIAEDNQRETALKEYIDKMSELFLHEDLLGSDPKKEVRETARIQTLTVLNRLDGKRKGSVLQFLYESRLIEINKSIVDLSGAELREVNLYYANLSEADLKKARLNEARLIFANLSGADLKKADLRDANLYYANLSFANLSGASLGFANLFAAKLIEADLSTANLGSVNLSTAILSGAHLCQANLHEANLSGATLSGADLSGADLSGADLHGAGLSGADLSGANLKDALNITTEELEEQAKSLQGTIMPDGKMYPHSSGANLAKADLLSANLSGVDLSGANLTGANLFDADLSGANLTGANLFDADLSGANLTGALIPEEQLAQAKSLQGATMPDGSIHP